MSCNRITRFLDEMQWLFSINNYDRNIIFAEKDSDHTAAKIECDERYQRITLTIYPHFLTLELEDQRKALLHELCHVWTLDSKALTFDLLEGTHVTFEQAKNVNEVLTSRLENVLNGLLSDRLKYAKTGYKNYLKKKKNGTNKRTNRTLTRNKK
jgi:hypothetical protein